LVFSGRPDPTWLVAESVSRRLEKIWDGLEPFLGEKPSPPVLGYRGCFFRDTKNNREWLAFGGIVELKERGVSTLRRDHLQAFERLLLSSAPEGSLPTPFIEKGW
jgi:hypothetical protein